MCKDSTNRARSKGHSGCIRRGDHVVTPAPCGSVIELSTHELTRSLHEIDQRSIILVPLNCYYISTDDIFDSRVEAFIAKVLTDYTIYLRRSTFSITVGFS